jgi:16S rRNA (cytosine967-C5)-methyltransferase
MTPSARIAAAADILDAIVAGAPAEETLIRWARRNRYAGSGDRHGVRDLVFDALRCRRSFGALGGSDTGRGLMIGRLRAQGQTPESHFTGEGYGPPPLSPEEAAYDPEAADLSAAQRLDLPDWILPALRDNLGDNLDANAEILKSRAPLGLRVNLAKASHDSADAALRADGIESMPHPLAETARVVTQNPRRVARSAAYLDGLVELQDPASQAVVEAVMRSANSQRVLDYCAGGGGKALALAAATGGAVSAHDADATRMVDIEARAARAGAQIEIIQPGAVTGLWDLVLVDAPCSGSGAWRRQPDAKWRLTSEGLADLQTLQAKILDEACAFVDPNGGVLAYATCSLLDAENSTQIAAFLERHKGAWTRAAERRFHPTEGGDGFYLAQLTRNSSALRPASCRLPGGS